MLAVVGGVWATWTLRSPLSSLWSSVRHRSAQPMAVSFAVVGDNHGDNPIYRQILTEIETQPVDFLLNLADTSENGTAAEFTAVKELESKLPFPVYHTVGNHDIKTDPSRQLFTQVFHQAPWRAYDLGQLHVVILDNADRRVGFSTDSLDWLAGDLARHPNQTIIVAYHRPFDLPLTKLLGDDETVVSRRSNQRLVELLEHYQVRQILTGHLHTYLQYSVGDIPAVVSGGGGDPAQSVLGGPAANYFHYLIVTVQNNAVNIAIHRVEQRSI